MISLELRARIRRLFYAEHWKMGTIAAELVSLSGSSASRGAPSSCCSIRTRTSYAGHSSSIRAFAPLGFCR